MNAIKEPTGRKPILVLEDDANDAILIRRAFTKSNCRAFVCRNTSEARAYLHGAGMYSDRNSFPFPEIFITDLRLGDGDESGIDFLEWLRSEDGLKDLEVIVLSGVATPDDVHVVKRLGARVFIKPSDSIALQDLLIQLVREFCTNPMAYRHEDCEDRHSILL